ncbi:MAG: 2-oxoacid:acceptor oxidoreductase family protein [Phycisphaerae bacterium]
MIEMTIYGRGGQGGVTLAKLIATTHFLRGKDVQAFGVYAAERSGAPLQAFVRVDDRPITNHNQVQHPDHVIVLDPTLIASSVLTGLKDAGWLILNTPQPAAAFADLFPGRRVATIDATKIAIEHGLGTRTVPIVNTTMLGALARVFELPEADAQAALAELKFGGANITALRQAYRDVVAQDLKGTPSQPAGRSGEADVVGIMDEAIGGMPRIRTGSWASRRPDRRTLTPPCNNGCPAGNDVQAFVAAMGKEDYDRALAILLETSPLPGVCGRVCPAPCMESCNRSRFDESVNIRDLERAAASYGRRPKPTAPWRTEKIGVVGGGPAGLSAAYHLARLGYPVTLHDAEELLGGVMRTGIPSFRLPRDVLDTEIDYILQHGVSVHSGEFLDRAALLNHSRRYAAMVAGTGLQRIRSVDLGADGQQSVSEGIEFLKAAQGSAESLDGQRVVVVGGGNTACDAARTARRLGARSVRILYRRTRQEMPAIREEIEEAIEEGIVLEELVSPVRLHHDGAGPVLTCTRMRLGEPDASGRPRPVPEVSEDAQFEVRADRVILALGQSPDQSILPEGSEVRQDGRLLGLTGSPIFFCGDFATNEGTVSAAIASGRFAAFHLHRTLTGEDLFPESPPPVAGPEDITTHVFERSPMREGRIAPPRFRTRTFAEIRAGFQIDPVHTGGESDAVAEARRCFSCGVCNQCDRCVEHCPEGVLFRDGDGYRFDFDYCKGCGVCSAQCPRGVIYMAEL